jgi:hypothetical protein
LSARSRERKGVDERNERKKKEKREKKGVERSGIPKKDTSEGPGHAARVGEALPRTPFPFESGIKVAG